MDSATLWGLLVGGGISIVSGGVGAYLSYRFNRRMARLEWDHEAEKARRSRQLEELDTLRPEPSPRSRAGINKFLDKGGVLLNSELRPRQVAEEGFFCFPESTRVMLSDDKDSAISDLQVGDEVAAFDHVQLTRGARVISGKRSGIGNQMVTINQTWTMSGGQSIFAGGRYVQARDLRLGDVLVSDQSAGLRVISLELSSEEQSVISLELDGPFGYFVGPSAGCRVLVQEAIHGKMGITEGP